MSGGKAFQQYIPQVAHRADGTPFTFMATTNYGGYFHHSDHLTAIRNARAEAFEEAAKLSRRAAPKVIGGSEYAKGQAVVSKRVTEDILALAAKERA